MYACGVVLTLLYASVLGSFTWECIWDESGNCIERCPPDTFSYNPGCVTTMSRRTCRAPVARFIGEFCDYSRCDCDATKVWDEAARKCVLLEECSRRE